MDDPKVNKIYLRVKKTYKKEGDKINMIFLESIKRKNGQP